MALIITDDCIICDVCAPECPNGAISKGREIYEVESDLCTECVGHFDEPQCQMVCPVECIVNNSAFRESKDQLQQKFLRLSALKGNA